MVIEHAPAKLNVALHVRARRSDGYHELETLFAFVAFGDVIEVETAQEDSFGIDGPFGPMLSGEGNNLVTRAARRFAEVFGGGAHAIRLEKHLPIASGIGGGSADAAATLRALARLHGVAIDDPRLFTIADGLGSDVPACLYGKPAIGRGRGEQLEPVPPLPATPVLLINPGVAVPTAEVFRRWDQVDRGPLGADYRLGRNDLEAPARDVAPVIGEVLALLAAQPGVTLARMSGSGATCFGLFEDEHARAAARAARARGWWAAETHLA